MLAGIVLPAEKNVPVGSGLISPVHRLSAGRDNAEVWHWQTHRWWWYQ